MKFSDFSNEKYRLNSFSVRIKYQPTVPNFLDSSLTDLGGFKPVIDSSTGEITGYTTTIGGADTVFPFKSGGAEILYINFSKLSA